MTGSSTYIYMAAALFAIALLTTMGRYRAIKDATIKRQYQVMFILSFVLLAVFIYAMRLLSPN